MSLDAHIQLAAKPRQISIEPITLALFFSGQSRAPIFLRLTTERSDIDRTTLDILALNSKRRVCETPIPAYFRLPLSLSAGGSA